MKFNSDIHHRRSIRLRGYDYSQSGAYFVTLVTHTRECLLGEVVDGKMKLNKLGNIVAESWQWLSRQYDYVELDEWVVMLNHLHGIIVIVDDDNERRGGSRTAPTTDNPVKRKSLGRLIGAFKTVSTAKVNTLRQSPGAVLWQRNYYEHIIRNDRELEQIRGYILDNPANWASDAEYVNR